MMSAPTRQWRILVMGCGSIGRRHARNLLALEQHQVHLVDPDPATLSQACEELGVSGSRTLAQGLAWSPEAAIIATPTSMHVDTALELARHRCHLFIEKPLGASLEGTDALVQLARAHRLVTLVGCNMRFHPGPRLVHQTLAAGAIGSPLGARLEVGSYLPSWHPGHAYQYSYSAQEALGGGCVLDAIHELDLACWWFGWPKEVVAALRPGTSLGIETEELAELLLWFDQDVVVSVHMDYVQRWRQRRSEIIGAGGTLLWDRRTGHVQLYRAQDERPQLLSEDAEYDLNRMYRDELAHWLRCLDGAETPCADVEWGLKVLRLALAAKESARKRQAVALMGEPAPTYL